MSKPANSMAITLEVYDPANRRTKTWHLSLAAKMTGKIIKKHISNKSEPWDAALEPTLLASLRAQEMTTENRQALQLALLHHAAASCARPQAMVFDELRDLKSPDSIRCCLLVARCGLLIAVRNTNSNPKIHSAYFRRGVAHTHAPERWKKLVRELRNEHVVADRKSGKLAYPSPDVVKHIQDDEHRHRDYWRTRIDFLSKHTWGFVEQDGELRPTGNIPPWEVKL